MTMDYVLSSIECIDVAANEIITTHSINRNYERLLNNDKELEKLKDMIYDGKIKPWSEHQIYNKGDIIWYKKDNHLYILKSLKEHNTSVPTARLKNNRQFFNDSGWQDANEYSTLFQDDISVLIGRYFNSMIIEDHENNPDYHVYNEMRLSSIDDYMLKKDMSNIK